jgi:hypothetical protein
MSEFINARFEVFTAAKISWVVTPFGVVEWVILEEKKKRASEDGGSKVLRNVILQQHHTASQQSKPGLDLFRFLTSLS